MCGTNAKSALEGKLRHAYVGNGDWCWIAGASREEIATELANAAPLSEATPAMGRPVDAEKEAEPYKAAEAVTGTQPLDEEGPVQMEQD